MRIRWLYRLGVLFFPERCPYCGKLVEPEELACEKCLVAVRKKHLAIQSGAGGFRCLSSFVYDGKIRKIILRIKYYERTQFIAQLAAFLAEDIRAVYGGDSFDLITGVPMYPNDQLEREYNQSELLAMRLSELLSMPHCTILKKVKKTKKQHSLNYADRKTNLSGAFRLCEDADIRGKRILLVDDIVTSGNTLDYCCRALKRGKPSLICCATLATAKEKYPPETVI